MKPWQLWDRTAEIANLEAIVKGNEICNAYSMDVISAGSSIAFAMECYEKGLLTSSDTGGLVIKFGDEQIMLKLLEMMGNRQGFGNLLAEGVARMAKKNRQGIRGLCHPGQGTRNRDA